MSLKKSKKRSAIKRGIGLFGLSSTILYSSAAVAGSVSLMYTALQMPDSLVANWLVRPLALAGLVTVGTSSTSTLTLDPNTGTVNTTTTTTTPSPTPTPTPSVSAMPTKIGVNVTVSPYYGKARQFMNLVSGDNWHLQTSAGQKIADTTGYVDANGNIVALLNSGDNAKRQIMPTEAVLAGRSTDILCRWDGTGTLRLESRKSTANPSYGANQLRFTYVAGQNDLPTLKLTATSSSDPVRNLDCREPDADPAALFAPSFLANMKKYNTIRYMDWQNINANNPTTWANRTTPSKSYYMGQDGYAIEYMIELANETDTNMWVNVPWNADADYIRQFATMVRDTLKPGLKVYVETSNEVWNWSFAVTSQARDEGLAEGLSTNEGYAMNYRYAERTIEVMTIWENVFAGQMDRLVRVCGSQNWDGIAQLRMGWRDGALAPHVDAIASAPYFGLSLTSTSSTTLDNIDSFFFPILRTKLDDAIAAALKVKAVADQYGKRYITYEAGQHVLDSDVTRVTAIQRDPLMGQLYDTYFAQWQQNFGDLMMLYNDVGPISKFGSWGMQEYSDQPISEAPKAQAVRQFIASIDNH